MIKKSVATILIILNALVPMTLLSASQDTDTNAVVFQLPLPKECSGVIFDAIGIM